MNDFSDGELNFTDREKLEAWLETQPREVSVVIAARAALRALPLLRRGKREPRDFATLTFASFWASALARVAAKYPTRANDFRSRAANNYAVAAASSAAAADAAAADAAAYAAAYAAAAAYVADATVPAAAAAAADSAAYAAADAAAAADVWKAVSADANRLKSVAPSVFASEKLWLGKAPPNWVHENYSELLAALGEPHWRPWLDWYQRRINGREETEDIELLFATLPVDPPEKAVAEQNAELARRIAELQEAWNANKPPHADHQWDFFISYSNKDEADAREIADILERAGHSTFAQFKDIAPGNNFVREMQQGLESSRRFVALLSPAYEASNHCQAEWAAAYNRDPGGAGRKILPLLVRKTNLNALASQTFTSISSGFRARRAGRQFCWRWRQSRCRTRSKTSRRLSTSAGTPRIASLSSPDRRTRPFSPLPAAVGTTTTGSTPAARQLNDSSPISPRNALTRGRNTGLCLRLISTNCRRRRAAAISCSPTPKRGFCAGSSKKTSIFWRARSPNGSTAFSNFTSRCGPSIRASAVSMTM